MLLRKLGSYSRKNPLDQAFRGLGKVVRTMLLLLFSSGDSTYLLYWICIGFSLGFWWWTNARRLRVV